MTGLDDVAPGLAGVIDHVGGPLLTAAFALVADGGLALAVGQASQQDTTFDLETLRRLGGVRRLEPFAVGADGPFGTDLAELLRLVEHGGLDPQVGLTAPWDQAPSVAEALLARRVAGKAVLVVE